MAPQDGSAAYCCPAVLIACFRVPHGPGWRAGGVGPVLTHLWHQCSVWPLRQPYLSCIPRCRRSAQHRVSVLVDACFATLMLVGRNKLLCSSRPIVFDWAHNHVGVLVGIRCRVLTTLRRAHELRVCFCVGVLFSGGGRVGDGATIFAVDVIKPVFGMSCA